MITPRILNLGLRFLMKVIKLVEVWRLRYSNLWRIITNRDSNFHWLNPTELERKMKGEENSTISIKTPGVRMKNKFVGVQLPRERKYLTFEGQEIIKFGVYGD